ncbi:DUF1349 domain-containing protein [Chitinophaga lutea]
MKTLLLCTTLLAATLQVSAQQSVDGLGVIPHTLRWETNPDSFAIRSGDAFTMKAAKGTDLYTFIDGSFYINKVPKLLFRPDSNFIFSAKLSPDFAGLYDGGAILLYADSANWAKVLIEQMSDGRVMIGSSVVRNNRTDDSYHAFVPDREAWLKLAKSGNIWCFYYATNGLDWQLVRTFAAPGKGMPFIGFYAQSPKGEGLRMDVSQIRYRNIAFSNFFTGE